MPKKYRLSNQEELIICKEYTNGMSLKGVTKIHPGVSYAKIRNVLESGGIKIRSVGGVRKYHCNYNFFNIIDTEEKAYWLGFFEADGHILKANGIQIYLGRKDRHQLEKFLLCIEADNPIHDSKYFDKRYNKWFFYSSIKIHYKQMKDDLLKHKKNIFVSLLEELKSHFIRGLFDGDGSVFESGIVKSPGFKMLVIPSLTEKIQEYLIEKVNLNRTKLYKYNTIWCISYYGRNQIKRIYDFLYKDASIWLERKYDIFLRIERKRPILDFPLTCSIVNCKVNTHAKGLCKIHYGKKRYRDSIKQNSHSKS